MYPNQLIDSANLVLEKLENYMTANNLLINEKKSQYLLFKPTGTKTPKTTGKLFLKNAVLQRVSQAKYLGIIIDEKLKFKAQYEKLLIKLKEAVNALICTRTALNYKAKFMLYNGIFKSHTDYGAISYHDKLNNNQIENLERLQNIVHKNLESLEKSAPFF